MNTRIEEDLLGSKEVPEDAYYGIHTVRAIENFPISGHTINDAPQMIRGMVMVKRASALANKELGAIPWDVADAIVAACDEVLVKGRCMDQFPVDVFQGSSIGIVTFLNEFIGHRYGDLVGKECARSGRSVREVGLPRSEVTA